MHNRSLVFPKKKKEQFTFFVIPYEFEHRKYFIVTNSLSLSLSLSVCLSLSLSEKKFGEIRRTRSDTFVTQPVSKLLEFSTPVKTWPTR